VLSNIIDVPKCHLHLYGESEKDDFDKFLGTLHSRLWPSWQGNKQRDPKDVKDNKRNRLERKLGIFSKEEPYHIPVRFKIDVYDTPFTERREEKKYVDRAYRDENLDTNEKSGFKEHDERLLKMRQMKLEKIEDTQISKYGAAINKKEAIFKPKENRGTINGILKETQLPNLSELVDHRVSRLKRALKYGYEGYGDYLLKKLGVKEKPTSRQKENVDEGTRKSLSPPKN